MHDKAKYNLNSFAAAKSCRHVSKEADGVLVLSYPAVGWGHTDILTDSKSALHDTFIHHQQPTWLPWGSSQSLLGSAGDCVAPVRLFFFSPKLQLFCGNNRKCNTFSALQHSTHFEQSVVSHDLAEIVLNHCLQTHQRSLAVSSKIQRRPVANYVMKTTSIWL